MIPSVELITGGEIEKEGYQGREGGGWGCIVTVATIGNKCFKSMSGKM